MTESNFPTVILHSLILCGVFCGSALGQVQEEDKPVVDPVECFRRSGQPCGTVGYGPYSGTFILDSVAPGAAAFAPKSFLHQAGEKWKLEVLSGNLLVGESEEEIRVIQAIPISAFGRTFPGSRLTLIEHPYGDSLPELFDGVLGLPYLESLRLRINARQHFAEIDNRQVQDISRCVMVALNRNRQGSPCIDVRISEAVSRNVRVNIAAVPFLRLKSATLKHYCQTGYAVLASNVPDNPEGAASSHLEKKYLLRSLEIGGLEFQDVLVEESDEDQLGMGCFSHFDLVLDFPKNEMWLTRHSDDWPKRVPPDASGMALAFLDTNALSLLHIEPGSAASKRDLKTGDQILLFEGKEPRELSMYGIRQRLTQAGTSLPLRIRRGGQEMDVLLPLKHSFEYPPKWSNKKNSLDDFSEFLEKNNE